MPVEKSYNFDHFSHEHSRTKLERLRIQAAAIAAIEMPRLLVLGLGSAENILDMGCGPGFISAEIARRCPEAKVTGLDSSKNLLEAAREIIRPEIENLDFHQGDALHTGLEDNRFDFVYNRLIYQHLADPAAALKEAVRITRPGGTVCIVDIDDRLLLTHPELKQFEMLMQFTLKAKKASGGDRQIGVKLPAYMEKAGLNDVRVRMECITSLDIGWDAFHRVAVQFHYRYAQTEAEKQIVRSIEAELAGLDQKPFGIAGIIIATGKKEKSGAQGS